MIEIAGQHMAGIIILCLFIGVVIGTLLFYHYGVTKCEHEWEKVIDDSINLSSGTVMGHQIVFFCKKCGKYNAKMVNYDKVRKV